MAFDNNNPQNPNAPRRDRVGTGFTNLNRLIGVNQNNRLGSTIGGGINTQAQTARQGVQDASSRFNQDSEAKRLDTDANKQRVQTVLGGVENATDDDVKAFETFRAGRYEGPKQLDNQQQLLNTAQSAETLGNLGTTQGGRQALLQRFVGGAGYNQGKQRLDNLLLGRSAGDNLRNARRETAGLTDTVQNAAGSAVERANYLANQARAFGQDVTNQTTTLKTQGDTNLNTYVDTVKTAEQKRQELFKQVRDQLAGVDWSNEEAGLNKVNEALGLASDYVGTEDEGKLIRDLYTKSKTPVEQLIKQTRVGDRSGMFGYGETSAPITTYSSAAPVTTQLKINDLLRDSFATKTAENVNRAGLVTDVDKKKLNNLARLLGMEQEFTDPNAARYKAGTGAFDFNKAHGDLDKDIARLKGDNITDLGTIYEETPLDKKLMRTLAPSGQQAGKDLSHDLGSLFGDDQSVKDRIGAWTGVVTNPYRMAWGNAASSLKTGAEAAETGINQIGHGDVVEGVKTLNNAPTEMLNNSLSNVNDYLAEIPGVGKITKPLGDFGLDHFKAMQEFSPLSMASDTAHLVRDAAGNVVGTTKQLAQGDILGAAKGVGNISSNAISQPLSMGIDKLTNIPIFKPLAPVGDLAKKYVETMAKLNPVNVAANVGGAVVNTAKKIFKKFCYVSGTQIKMKNGSYKAVQDLKVGDEVYLGGKVTMTGESESNDIYEYKNVRVTGSHTVFESGRFVRVEDSPHAKKVSGKEKIYPVETEKHILVTKTHIGADFTEVDDSDSLNMEQVIKKLNSDTKKITKLSNAELLLFAKKNGSKVHKS
jgi:hypothetical protein